MSSFTIALIGIYIIGIIPVGYPLSGMLIQMHQKRVAEELKTRGIHKDQDGVVRGYDDRKKLSRYTYGKGNYLAALAGKFHDPAKDIVKRRLFYISTWPALVMLFGMLIIFRHVLKPFSLAMANLYNLLIAYLTQKKFHKVD